MVRLVSAYTLIVTLVVVSVAQADWHYDFEGPEPPEGLEIYHEPDTTTTFAHSTDGYLRLYDPMRHGDGGTIVAGANNKEEFADVRVSAIINPNGDTPNMHQVVLARNQGSGQGNYWASFQNNPTVGNSGRLAVGKFLSTGDSEFSVTSGPPITDFHTPYLLQLEAQDDVRASDGREYVQLDAKLFDETGSTVLLSISKRDYGSVQFPIYTSGYSGVHTNIQWENVNLDAVFDDIGSVSLVVPGDYNRNRELDVGDLDRQADAIVTGDHPPEYDLTGDALVNTDDRVYWVHELKSTWFGDADLDDEFNSSDMVQVFVAGKYETSESASWAEGDWDGNALFDSSDMVTAFADGGYEQGPRTDAVAVPEPGGWLLSILGVVTLLRRCRRVGRGSS